MYNFPNTITSRSAKPIQLIAKFQIFPSSKSRHSFVENYTSSVVIEKYFGFVLLYNYPSLRVLQQISKCYLLGENNYNFPHDPLDNERNVLIF